MSSGRGLRGPDVGGGLRFLPPSAGRYERAGRGGRSKTVPLTESESEASSWGLRCRRQSIERSGVAAGAGAG